MALPVNNLLRAVQTYTKSGLGMLYNSVVYFKNANMKYKNFQNEPANLGDTVTFDKPPRALVNDSLVATFQGAEQRIQSLTVNRAKNVSYMFNNQQMLFNINPNDYMPVFIKSGVATLANVIEKDIGLNSVNHTYRFYGNTTTGVNSYTELARALARFRDYGANPENTKGFLPLISVPNIIGTGLNQFVPGRNEEAANSWELGSFGDCEFFASNLLPKHNAGTLGNDGTVLTVTSISPDGTQITFSGAGTDNSAFKEGDLIEFQDVTPAYTVRFLTWINGGDQSMVSSNPVQLRVTADAASSGGNVTVSVYPALISDPANVNCNIDKPIVAGMQAIALGDHRAGMLMSGDPLYIAMPTLPDESPFVTGTETDPETGISLRMYYGSVFGQNQRGTVIDQIWGSTLADENAMRLIFPV